jgi:hypothetical protein
MLNFALLLEDCAFVGVVPNVLVPWLAHLFVNDHYFIVVHRGDASDLFD